MLGAALRLTRLQTLGLRCVAGREREAGQGKAAATRAEGHHDEARKVSREHGAAPSHDHTEPAAYRSTVQTCQSLAWRCELLPVFPHCHCDVNPILVHGGQGASIVSLSALRAPENPRTASGTRLAFLLLLLSIAAAEAPGPIHLLCPVGQTRRQVLDAATRILLLPIMLPSGCYPPSVRETGPCSKPCG